ncbi:MAG: hypothetical protein D6741_06100 [Planctomycetota bacterium]|nr:MAG: hypothetical protein D6741_06100 [Planctomycetota bacterium]
MRSSRIALSVLVAALVSIVGCGGPKMASVEGTVTCNGQPVKGVIVVFNPVPSDGETAVTRPSMGVTDDAGHYVLSTEREGDGAAVGKHKVSISPAAQTDDTTEPEDVLPGTLPKDYVVEVKPGDNTIDLELTPSKR